MDLTRLPKYSICLKLMINGASSKPFSAITVDLNEEKHNYSKEVLENSRKKYGRIAKNDEVSLFEGSVK